MKDMDCFPVERGVVSRGMRLACTFCSISVMPWMLNSPRGRSSAGLPFQLESRFGRNHGRSVTSRVMTCVDRSSNASRPNTAPFAGSRMTSGKTAIPAMRRSSHVPTFFLNVQTAIHRKLPYRNPILPDFSKTNNSQFLIH